MNYREFKATDFQAIPQGEKINARVLDLEINKATKAFVFSEKEGTYSCILPVMDTDTKLPELQGLVIQYQEFRLPDTDLAAYILLECRTPAYLGNFTEILKEIIDEFDKGKHQIVTCVHLVIAKWRHFLAKPINQIMEEEQIIGLIGELMLLEKLISVFKSEAINLWVADGGEVDFIKNDKDVEVKATLKGKHEHIINGIDQLRIIPDRKKYILSLLFFKSGSDNSLTLPKIVTECSQKIIEFPDAVDIFFKNLKVRGYDIRDVELYAGYKYDFIKGGYFEISDSFPKLTTDELRAPLSSRINKVRYTVDMEGLPNSDFHTTAIDQLF